MTVSNP